MSKNKTILIIGASSDIALAVAHKFASEGYNLQLAARNSYELETVSKDLQIRYQVDISLHELDILEFSSFQNFIESLSIIPDIAISVVGKLGNQKEDELSIIDSSLIMKTNYEGPSLLLGEIANLFEKRKSGTIIGISSVAGERGRASNYIYGSAKAGFSSTLSGLRNRLYTSNIRVLTVLPGYVKTKMTQGMELPYFLTSSPEEISTLVFRNIKKSKVVYPFPWNIVMAFIKLIPEKLFMVLKL
jgi:decaprenylphospho-beta-D-erythro-pentofuranosid-2-ulose 2-reductase